MSTSGTWSAIHEGATPSFAKTYLVAHQNTNVTARSTDRGAGEDPAGAGRSGRRGAGEDRICGDEAHLPRIGPKKPLPHPARCDRSWRRSGVDKIMARMLPATPTERWRACWTIAKSFMPKTRVRALAGNTTSGGRGAHRRTRALDEMPGIFFATCSRRVEADLEIRGRRAEQRIWPRLMPPMWSATRRIRATTSPVQAAGGEGGAGDRGGGEAGNPPRSRWGKLADKAAAEEAEAKTALDLGDCRGKECAPRQRLGTTDFNPEAWKRRCENRSAARWWWGSRANQRPECAAAVRRTATTTARRGPRRLPASRRPRVAAATGRRRHEFRESPGKKVRAKAVAPAGGEPLSSSWNCAGPWIQACRAPEGRRRRQPEAYR